MNRNKIHAAVLLLCGLILSIAFPAAAAPDVPAPEDVLGFSPGDDRKLAPWSGIVDYFKKLAAASARVEFRETGRTTLDRPFVHLLISSPANLKNLERYTRINDRLADPRTFGRRDREAEKLIRRGKTFVLITHGIHSTEVGSTLSSMLIAHRLASSDDARIRKILDETIVVLVPSLNPDGVDIVKDWYERTLGTDFEGTSPPELYHKYVGHDNNRDWYAFTQPETRLTVEKLHNVYHPQIVHDIHQQGRDGARFFVPPYLDPVEPNVPPEIIEGYTEIGLHIASQMRAEGFRGITTGSTYDAWTPARAYSHYHGGARILSETASARLATPVEIDFGEMRSRRGFDVKQESPNYGPLWKGGKWTLRDITDHMTAGAFHLLDHAAGNRAEWLRRFYRIGREATRPRGEGELYAFVLPFPEGDDAAAADEYFRREELIGILQTAGVETHTVNGLRIGDVSYPDGTVVVPLAQPYGSFAKAVLERQVYPNLLDENGDPVRPYDVTAHTLPLLMGVDVREIRRPFKYKPAKNMPGFGRGCSFSVGHGDTEDPPARKPVPRAAVYRSSVPVMDEGWTRWVLERGERFLNRCGPASGSAADADIRSGRFAERVLVIPDQSPESILGGYEKGSMPDEFTGGIGEEGLENLKKFAYGGGTLVFLNRSSDLALEKFDLPVRNIAGDWESRDFYIPGSILRTELDTSHPLAEGMPARSVAWFERSPVFEVKEGSGTKVVARYPSDPGEILLSGWALGAERIAGRAALVEVPYGDGRIILFGFRPQYRGQSLATFPLLFNALER